MFAIISAGMSPTRSRIARKANANASTLPKPTKTNASVTNWAIKRPREAPSALRRLLIALSAVIVAPLFEEFLFRGHLQTLLVRVFRAQQRAHGFPMITSSGETVPPPIDDGKLPAPFARWLAVIIASALFTLARALSTALPAGFERAFAGNVKSKVLSIRRI